MSARCWRFGFAGVMALAACAPPAAEQSAAPMAVDTAAVQAAAAAFWPRWIAAVTSGDSVAMGGLLADSVRIDSKGLPPVLGRAGWMTALETMLKGTKVESEVITPEQTSVISNEMAYQTGDFVETTTTAGKSQTEYGRFAAAIRKGADGQWRLSYVMAFADSTVPVKK